MSGAAVISPVRLSVTGLLMITSVAAQTVQLPEFDCIIEPNMTVKLSSPVAGVIESINVDRSDPVEAGQVVAKLQSGVEEALVVLAGARANFTGEIEAKRARRAFSKRKQARTDELHKKGALPFHVKDEAQTEAIVAGIELKKAEHKQRLAEL